MSNTGVLGQGWDVVGNTIALWAEAPKLVLSSNTFLGNKMLPINTVRPAVCVNAISGGPGKVSASSSKGITPNTKPFATSNECNVAYMNQV